MKGRKSCILQCDILYDVQTLSNQDAGILFLAILNFINDLPIGNLNIPVTKIFDKIKLDIEKEWDKINPMTGKYHWNYKGGITPENKAIRNSMGIKLWRVKVFERDKYTCQNCKKSGGVLHAHHKKHFSKFPELRTELANGITLCKSCHNKIHKLNG